MIRGILQQVIEGAIKRFSAFGRTDETISDREYFQHYGFTSRPKPGAECIIIKEGNHIIMIASDDRRYRIALDEGEVALYTDEGDKVHLKRDRNIEIVAGAKITITAPEAEISGNLTVDGNIKAHGNVTDSVRSMAADRTIYNGHTHPGGGVPNGQM